MSGHDGESDLQREIAALDARLRELEAVQQLILRILSTTKPLDNLLEQYGANDTQERAFYHLLDDLASRLRAREQDRPTFAYFQMKVQEIFPALRHDREFVRLLIDTLRIERPAYRELGAYAMAQGWLA
jgi:hypothetical protein